METPLLMLIDDEFGVRESLKMVFNKSYRLLEADSVDAAIAKLNQARPDVVLLDVMMPNTDGLQMLYRIKELHPNCEVIMLTGLNSQQLAEQALNVGAFDFVGKPFDVIELRDKVSRAAAQAARKAQPSPVEG